MLENVIINNLVAFTTKFPIYSKLSIFNILEKYTATFIQNSAYSLSKNFELKTILA